MLAPDELKLLHPRRRLAPFSPPSPLDIMMEGEQGEDGEQEDDGSQWKDRVSWKVVIGLWSTGLWCCLLSDICPHHPSTS
jgi:hypothetical protein